MPINRNPQLDLAVELAPGEDFTVGGDLTEWLASGETVSSCAAATQEKEFSDEDDARDIDDITDLTVGSPDGNAETFTNHKGETVAIDKGVRFTVEGATNGVVYYVTVAVTTSTGNVFKPVWKIIGTKGYGV